MLLHTPRHKKISFYWGRTSKSCWFETRQHTTKDNREIAYMIGWTGVVDQSFFKSLDKKQL